MLLLDLSSFGCRREDLEDFYKKDCDIPDTTGRVIQSEVQRFIADTIVSGLGVPWGLVFLPDGSLLIAQREGGIAPRRLGLDVALKFLPHVTL